MRTLILTLLFSTSTAFAAIELPDASPRVSITQEIGISKATINYHRPAVKGRTVWGELVPANKIWRLGANDATTLEISHPARIGGNDVPAGKYALFAIPTASEWTFVVNKKHEQWGAFFHDDKDDLLRFKARPQQSEFREWFDIDMTPVDDKTIRVDVQWEKVRVPFTIEFDTPRIVWKQIDDAVAAAPASDWETWHQAARHAFTTGERLDQGMIWVDKALAASESFWNYELKGRMLHKVGRTEEAYPFMEKAKELAAGKAPAEWAMGIDRDVAGWRAAGKKP